MMICPRCTKNTNGVHTCTPTPGWREMEEKLRVAREDMRECYEMLLTEPIAKKAADTAENMLRDALAKLGSE